MSALLHTRDTLPVHSTPATRREQPFLRSTVIGLLLAIVLVQSGKMMPQTFFGLFAEQVLHAPAWLTGLCYGATALGICLAAPYWAKRFVLYRRSAGMQ